ncbi:eukaryotic translation initiation factor 2 alpha kinase Gcn2 isoform X4 [Andrena cerasifolii]|uniref:eukaryotic translation initiation factor 2 alpha kinase Gcn2 isoform X4 n=1 Tax=Andrena cerasifolii TaxID=2819439 RepID=UPI00403761D1
MSCESCKDRQENEIEVLKSIFGDELQDLRRGKSKRKWQPLDISVTLIPQRGMSGPAEVYAQIDLHVTCSDKYPEEIPTIELQNSRGLSHQQIAVLNSELMDLTRRLQGEVVIFELAQHVQKYLHENNKPSYSSFYEEMVSRHEEKVKYEMLEKQLKEDKERQVLQDEIQKRQEALKAEIRDRKESIRISSDRSNNPSQSIPSSPQERSQIYTRRRCASSCESSDGFSCEHKGTKLLHFDHNKDERQVYRGKCMGHSNKGSVVYAGVDMATGELFAISEWTLKVHNRFDDNSIQQITKQIGSLEQEVNHLNKLHHPNLVHYVNMKYLHDGDDMLIYVLQEFVHLGMDDIEKLAPPLQEIEWNISYKSCANTLPPGSDEDNSDASSDTDSDEDCAFLMRNLLRIDSSDSIEFEKDTNCLASVSSDKQNKNEEIDESKETLRQIQYMYIQMEFCEKSTLRTAIDGGLYEDRERVWRLFREIVEGLAHIHQQGMIHRDLKPVNIFLDSNDHVKIGDFGLATTNILPSFVQNMEIDKDTHILEKGISFGTEVVGSLTGQVGTALYVAPELTTKAKKAIYNQKVDIYSLGIILFEMSYKPLTTGMERIKVILNLRSRDIILPAEMQQADITRQIHILRWLLNHDPSQRPTAQELLSSEYLPPPRLEETELQEMIRRTLSNNQSKAYKYLISCCFMQEVTPADDITYDMNLPNRGHVNLLSWKKHQEGVICKVTEIFQRHGGVYLETPLLMPKSRQFCSFSDSSVKLMTRTGNVVCIPHDLRASFARYIVWNNVPHIRRYAIERVFREKKVPGFHPRQLYECAFDIISPTANNLLMEAELIYIFWELINELPPLQERNFTIQLNHTSLLKAVLIYCGIDQEKYQDIYSILRDARDRKFSRFQIQTHLISLCLTDQAMETLFNLFETESSIPKIHSVLKTITKRKGDAATLAKEGLKDIETVMENVEAFGVKWPVVVVPLLVHNINQHSGIIYQITCQVKRHRKKCGEEVIAAGGRYDKMLSSFKKTLERTEMTNKETKQYGVGISISLEKLVSAVLETPNSLEIKCGVDIAISCLGNPHREKEMIDLLREFWSLGLKVTILHLPILEETLEHCREQSINQVIILKPGEKGTARIQIWERDRFQEKKLANKEVGEFLQKLDNSIPILNRSESKITGNENFLGNNIPVNININFILSEKDKLSGSSRRSLKNSMLAQMSAYIQRIAHKIPIEVFAIFLEMSVIRTIIRFLETDEEEQDFLKSTQVIIDKHPRHKKYIKEICEEMREARKEKLRPVLILYSLMDNQYMALL